MATKLSDHDRNSIRQTLTANCACQNAIPPLKGKTGDDVGKLSDDMLVAYDQWVKAIDPANNAAPGDRANPGATTLVNHDGSRDVFDPRTNGWVRVPGPQQAPAQQGAGQAGAAPQAQMTHNQLQQQLQQQGGGQQSPPPSPALPHLVVNGVPVALPVPPRQSAPQTVEQFLADPSQPDWLKRMVQNNIQAEAQEKAQLIAALTANAATDELRQAAINAYNAMRTEDLRVLVQSLPPIQPQIPAVIGNWLGGAGAPPMGSQVAEEPLQAPDYSQVFRPQQTTH